MLSLRVSYSAISSVRRMFWSPGKRLDISKFLWALYMPYAADSGIHVVSSICFGRIKEPSV